METACMSFLLSRGVCYQVDANAVRVDNGEMAVAPWFVAKFNLNFSAFLFEVFIELVNIVNLNGQEHSLSGERLMEKRLLGGVLGE